MRSRKGPRVLPEVLARNRTQMSCVGTARRRAIELPTAARIRDHDKGPSKGSKKGDSFGKGNKKEFKGKCCKSGNIGHMSKDCRSREKSALEAGDELAETGCIGMASIDPNVLQIGAVLLPEEDHRIRIGIDSCAAVIVFSKGVADDCPMLRTPGKVKSYRLAPGKLLPDLGARKVQVKLKDGSLRYVNPRCADTHRALMAMSEMNGIRSAVGIEGHGKVDFFEMDGCRQRGTRMLAELGRKRGGHLPKYAFWDRSNNLDWKVKLHHTAICRSSWEKSSKMNQCLSTGNCRGCVRSCKVFFFEEKCSEKENKQWYKQREEAAERNIYVKKLKSTWQNFTQELVALRGTGEGRRKKQKGDALQLWRYWPQEELMLTNNSSCCRRGSKTLQASVPETPSHTSPPGPSTLAENEQRTDEHDET